MQGVNGDLSPRHERKSRSNRNRLRSTKSFDFSPVKKKIDPLASQSMHSPKTKNKIPRKQIAKRSKTLASISWGPSSVQTVPIAEEDVPEEETATSKDKRVSKLRRTNTFSNRFPDASKRIDTVKKQRNLGRSKSFDVSAGSSDARMARSSSLKERLSSAKNLNPYRRTSTAGTSMIMGMKEDKITPKSTDAPFWTSPSMIITCIFVAISIKQRDVRFLLPALLLFLANAIYRISRWIDFMGEDEDLQEVIAISKGYIKLVYGNIAAFASEKGGVKRHGKKILTGTVLYFQQTQIKVMTMYLKQRQKAANRR